MTCWGNFPTNPSYCIILEPLHQLLGVSRPPQRHPHDACRTKSCQCTSSRPSELSLQDAGELSGNCESSRGWKFEKEGKWQTNICFKCFFMYRLCAIDCHCCGHVCLPTIRRSCLTRPRHTSPLHSHAACRPSTDLRTSPWPEKSLSTHKWPISAAYISSLHNH